MSFDSNITLEEFYNTSDTTQPKKSIAELIERQDYKTHHTLPRRNQNVNMLDTRLLNEDIPQSDKRFSKPNGKLYNIAKYNNQSNSNSQIKCYEPKRRFIQTTLEYNSHIRAKCI